MKTIITRSRTLQKVCSHCKKQFYASRQDRQTCSYACSRQLRLSEKITSEVIELYEAYKETERKARSISY